MANHLLACALLVILGIMPCTATVYTVGGTSGWDISTDLDTWAQDKRFVVGDVLLFQYSAPETVNEVSKESYDGCNTTRVIQTSSNSGNTTVTLSKPGDRYFVSGNRLYCLGGMKLHVHVDGNSAAATAAPAQAPQAEAGGNLPRSPSSKSNNPTSVVPSSAAAVIGHGGVGILALGCVGYGIAALFLSV
ncbi:blue copper protein-like [Diospyros lotus]|uniref:blue copper protein-like n=1 Tax=Diospyros lotus TaxID=55363 RepID=UPI002251E34E|nr:blue copper protein-like [Diospyros lotus]